MKSIRHLVLALGCAVLLFAAVKPAAAATVTYEVLFSATDFFSVPPGTTPPVDLVLGQFDITLTIGANSGGVLNFDVMLPAQFKVPVNYLYTAVDDTLQLFEFVNSASLYINGLTNGTPNPVMQVFIYSSGGTSFSSVTGLVSATKVSAVGLPSVPLPAALPLFAAALSALGFTAWRRRSSGSAA
jgi:hypothetical protein